MEKKVVYLIHSYRGHGKDSFCLHPEDFEIIFSSSDIENLLFIGNLKRYAFADAVKEEVYPLLFGEEKNITREMKEGKRKEIIAYAEQKKKSDIFHWVKIVAKKIIESEERECIISDWRFPEELEFLEKMNWTIIKIRVKSLRCNIPEEKEERYLDDVIDDIVVQWKLI